MDDPANHVVVAIGAEVLLRGMEMRWIVVPMLGRAVAHPHPAITVQVSVTHEPRDDSRD
jgi:hypothetical protein